MPHTSWVLVANGSRARLFERSASDHALLEIMAWIHPEARQHMGSSETDHRTSGTKGRTGLAQPQSTKAHVRAQFAEEISLWLKHALNPQGRLQLAVIASNPFLGELLSHGHGWLERHVCAHHPLDLTSLPLAELDERLHREFGL